ncbi:MAG: UDP-N-acetylmuramate dehydrogenase [Acidobacteria bacterium]|nr:UDP-N-acetylmuramate dehydrogenase [Acidobacteriota bacterium]
MALRARIPLAPLSTLGVGGEARWFVRAERLDDVVAAHRWCLERNVTMLVLGGGSNLVMADEGIDGLVLQIALRGVEFSAQGEETVLCARAGEPWDDVVAASVSRGLAGFECLSGIPGSVGGTPIQNVGAYGQEVSDTLDAVTVFDRQSGEIVSLSARACRFAYRKSRFKQDDAGRFIVCEVRCRLRPGPPTITYPDVITYLEQHATTSPRLADVRRAVLAIRRRKGMVVDPADPDTRSVGSFFMNPVVPVGVHARISAAYADGPVPGFALPSGEIKIPAAWLIEHAGLSRGDRCGRAAISSKHPLAIVNLGGATARDVLKLAVLVKRSVANRFGIWLHPEPVFAGFRHDADVEFLERAGGDRGG